MPRHPLSHLTPLTYYLLAELMIRERGAYDLGKRIATSSSRAVVPTPGTMHHALKGLVGQGFVAAGNQPRHYRITDAGRYTLEQELKRLIRAVAVGRHATIATKPGPQLPSLPELP